MSTETIEDLRTRAKNLLEYAERAPTNAERILNRNEALRMFKEADKLEELENTDE